MEGVHQRGVLAGNWNARPDPKKFIVASNIDAHLVDTQNTGFEAQSHGPFDLNRALQFGSAF